MTVQLTPGRYRGLKGTSSGNHVFNILAFDQRGSYRKMLPAGTSFEDALQIKQDVVVTLSQVVSAVLLDNQYGLQSAQTMRGGCGLLMSLEESGYSGDATYRKLAFNPDWTIAKIKAMGGTAIKLMPYYHPGSGALATEVEAETASVIAEAHRHDLPVFLEPMSYSLDAAIAKESADFAAQRPTIVIETARRMSALGADVLKLEFPIDVSFNSDRTAWIESCEAVSAASSVPWVLLSAGVDFETFLEQTQIACTAGASGWLAGRAIWKESVQMTPENRLAFLRGVATERTAKLNAIADASARPWTDFYTPMPTSADWFKAYM